VIRLAGILLALCIGTANAAQFGDAQHKIVSDYGDEIANFDLNPDLAKRMVALTGQVPVGNATGDVTLYQFYDLNCPFCREAAAPLLLIYLACSMARHASFLEMSI